MLKRTEYCGNITEAFLDKEVVVNGWLDTRRDHGGVIFFDVRDREGNEIRVFYALLWNAVFLFIISMK